MTVTKSMTWIMNDVRRWSSLIWSQRLLFLRVIQENMGNMRETTVRSVRGVISKLCKIESGFKVKRKDQTGDSSHKPRWWFVIHGNESVLAKLDSSWGSVRTTLPGSFSPVTNLLIYLASLSQTMIPWSCKHHKHNQYLYVSRPHPSQPLQPIPLLF